MTIAPISRSTARPASDAKTARACTSPSSATKALRLLEVFPNAGPSLTASEIARLAGIARSTAFRLLAVLEEAGYVVREGRNYVLDQRMFELGNAVPMCQPSGLRNIALPYLVELYVATGHITHLAVLDGTDALYLEKICGLSSPQTATFAGARLPASATALGKAMLAFSERAQIGRVLDEGLHQRTRYSQVDGVRFLNGLRRINLDRVAFDHEESQLGMSAAAAPVLRDGRAVAAIEVYAPSDELNVAIAAKQVRSTAEAISHALV